MHAGSTQFRVRRLDAFVFRAPADPPVQTSFGIMRDRPAVLLRVTGDDDIVGWGEVWCNFPVVGAEHRARMALTYLPPLVCNRDWSDPGDCFREISRRLAVLAIQCGEPGTLNQIVAGLDMGIWDMLARRSEVPLWKLLTPDLTSARPVRLYASGINPTAPEVLAAQKMDEGYKAFKLKVGFGEERDAVNLEAMRATVGTAAELMVDANQAWDLEEAVAAGQRLARYDLVWLEEPIRADCSPDDWATLARRQPLPLAGGENLAGIDQFGEYIGGAGLSVIQPDLGKWGGFSGCVEVARMALRHGKTFCPHWLGAGIGLTASFHLKAAVGGDGYVEVDANPNPLRDMLAMPAFRIDDGAVHLGDAPGLGVEPDLVASRKYLIPIH